MLKQIWSKVCHIIFRDDKRNCLLYTSCNCNYARATCNGLQLVINRHIFDQTLLMLA